MPAVRTHTYRPLSLPLLSSVLDAKAAHTWPPACFFFFFLSHSNWNHNSRVLDQTRSEVCLLPHTVSLAHYYSARYSMPAHTRSGLFFFFFYRVTPTLCTRMLTHSNEWVQNARVVVKKKKKKTASVWNNEVRLNMKLNWTSEELVEVTSCSRGKGKVRDEYSFIFLIKISGATVYGTVLGSLPFSMIKGSFRFTMSFSF